MLARTPGSHKKSCFLCSALYREEKRSCEEVDVSQHVKTVKHVKTVQDARFSSLPDDLDVDRIFAETMEAQAPEFDFWDLLRECRDPLLSAATTWGQARRQATPLDDPQSTHPCPQI